MASTIYDVAERAGVSISTVSLALNAPHRVRDTTLRRVMDAVDQLGFLPKAEAVTRARRGVRRIAVLAPFSSHPTFAQRLNGVLRAATREHFEVTVYDQESAATSRLVSLPLTGRVDGLIVMSLPFGDDVAQRLAEQQIPTVLVDNTRAGFSSVTTDDAAGGRMVAELLIRRGHQRFGFLGQAQRRHDYVSQSDARLDGFRAALPSPPETRRVEHNFGAARAGAQALLRNSPRPTAIFAHDDLLASGVLRAARDLGLTVPTDLAVVGFDDAGIAEPLGLTSIRQPLDESGEIAAQILLDQLKDAGRSTRQTTLALTLIERDTTAT